MGCREIQVANDGIRGDRRIQRRYPIALELEYKVMAGGAVIATGTGRTGNISSGGVLFLTEEKLTEGPAVELSIRWPAMSGDVSFVELRMSGRIVRSDANGTAVEARRYHFQQPGNVGASVDQPSGTAMIH
jgi:c-di-GMP-binding flagellar brake protein YcgR